MKKIWKIKDNCIFNKNAKMQSKNVHYFLHRNEYVIIVYGIFFSIHFWLIPTWAKYIIHNFSIHFICSLIVLMHFSCICNAHVFHILYPKDSLRIESSDRFLSFPYFWPRPLNKKVKIWLWSHPQLFFKPTKYSELLNNLSQSFLNKIWEIYKSISNPIWFRPNPLV